MDTTDTSVDGTPVIPDYDWKIMKCKETIKALLLFLKYLATILEVLNGSAPLDSNVLEALKSVCGNMFPEFLKPLILPVCEFLAGPISVTFYFDGKEQEFYLDGQTRTTAQFVFLKHFSVERTGAEVKEGTIYIRFPFKGYPNPANSRDQVFLFSREMLTCLCPDTHQILCTLSQGYTSLLKLRQI